MFSSTWILVSLALCAAASAAVTTEQQQPAAAASKPAAEVKDAPAGAHYGGGYGGPSYSQPQYPVFQFPNFDVNYCSVHASFPLVGLRNGKHHGHHGRGDRVKRQNYGVPAQDSGNNNNYGGANTFNDAPSNSYGPSYGQPSYVQRPRPFERQGCRNTAIFNRKSCQNCCSISSRASGNTAPVVGIIMMFDPKLSADKKHNKHDDVNSPDRAIQCVCCTSRRV
uniref:Secreted protein n=1 Tax=Caenorhabditis tropicalis TaxID=1561998 RepID=A0A1I7UZ93_9PELO